MSAPIVTIGDALDDSDLFAPLFPRESWGAWRAFLGALFGMPMGEDAAALYRHHTGRNALPAQPFREAALIIGRRGGKSRTLGLIAAFLGAFVDYTPYLAPGEVPVIAIIAADRRQARVLLRYVIGTLQAVPLLAGMIDGEPLAESVTLTSGTVIEIHTSSIGSPRGRTFVAVLADEIAFWSSDEAGANPDTEVVAAVRPGLASIPNSVLLMASSPYARRGVLWEAFRRHWGKDDARVLVWRGTTAEMNPTLDPAVIAEAYEADPDSASSEYGAQFRTDVATFVPREVVDSQVVPGRYELAPLSTIAYTAFVDPSGGSADAMTLAVAHPDLDGRAVLDCLREVRPPFSPESVVAEFAVTLRAYNVSTVTGDRYGGEWPRERFREHGIAYEPSTRSKSDIYRELLPMLNAGRTELLDNGRLVAQFCALERRTARGGRDSIDHPPGGHDDTANAAAGALVAVASAAVPALWRRASLLVDGAPVELPRTVHAIYATMAVDARGAAAVLYWAQGVPTFGHRLILVDIDTAPLSPALFTTIAGRLLDLCAVCRSRRGAIGLAATALLADQANRHGLFATAIADPDLVALALVAAGHIAAGDVKVSRTVIEKAAAHPLGAILDATARPDDPVQVAALIGISVALDEGRMLELRPAA